MYQQMEAEGRVVQLYQQIEVEGRVISTDRGRGKGYISRWREGLYQQMEGL